MDGLADVRRSFPWLHAFLAVSLLTGADLWCLPLQRTDAPHFRPKFIPVPRRSALCPVVVALPADGFVVGGQESRARAALCV